VEVFIFKKINDLITKIVIDTKSTIEMILLRKSYLFSKGKNFSFLPKEEILKYFAR
jgi:hypothetical protein